MRSKTKKLIWAAPLMAAVAAIGALAIFMTLTPNAALAQQQEVVPGAPTDLQMRALDQSTIELKWTAPSDDAGGVPDGYRIDYSADGLVWYALVANNATTKYVDDEELEASETRHYRIFAFNTGGSSMMLGPASETTAASTAPEAPTALVVSKRADDTGTQEHYSEEHLTVSWTAPVDPPGAPVKSYRVQVSKNGSSFTDLKVLTAKEAGCNTAGDRVCDHIHKDLLENTKRWYRIYATNSVGESPASEVRHQTTGEGSIPALPPNLRAALNPAGEMWLYWDRPADQATATEEKYNPFGAPILGYYIQGGPVATNATAGTTPDFQEVDTAGTGLQSISDQDPKLSQVFYVEANTDVPLTSSVLNKLDDYGGRPSPNNTTSAIRTHWGFRVMAVNRVVQRNVEDGKIDAADGNWSNFIRVNNTPNAASLPKPTVTADRHTGSNRGRTGIELEWEVTGSSGTTEYRVEFSEDRIDWEALDFGDATEFVTLADLTVAVNNTDESGVHVGLVGSTRYDYRVFAVQEGATIGSGTILTEASARVTENTATPDRPNTPVLSTTIDAASETELEMTVVVIQTGSTPAVSGDSSVGFGKLVGYRIEISDDGKDWTKYQPVEIGPKLTLVYTYDEKTGKVTTSTSGNTANVVDFHHTGLTQDETRYYRASTINNAPGSLAYSAATEAKKGKTHQAFTSDDPGGLVAKAKDSSSIEIVWNARADDITAAPVDGYKIESSPLNAKGECAETWTVLEKNTMSTTTSYTHDDLAPSTGQCYRVFGINVVGGSTGFVGFGDAYATTYDNDAIATTDAATAPGTPTDVKATATSDTAITVEWMAPADTGGADITGYKLERKSGDGEFMAIAYSSVSTWWNMLDCAMMNSAVPADSTPAPGADSTSPYCKMYDGLAADAKMVVDAAFAASYGTITGTTYMDMGLTASTAYYYRVSAMNSAGTGMASDGMATATTDRSNAAPVAGDAIMDQTVVEGEDVSVDVSGNFSDADAADATLTYTAESGDTAIATVSVDGSTVTVTGEAVGTATITVTATDTGNMAGKLSAEQMFDVTVTAANTDPNTVGTIDNQSVVAGKDVTVDVAVYFADADGDTLTYASVSDDPAVATVNAVGNPVTITGVAAGNTVVTVTASDGMGGTDATQTIIVMVEAANRAPTPTDDPGLALPASVEVMVGGDDSVIALTGSFTDPDEGDTLTYSAMSSDTDVATATVGDGNMLTISAVAHGMATVTVTADDGNGGTATHDIAVTVTQPLVAPTLVATNPVGSGLVTVTWSVVPGASGYTILAINAADPNDYVTEANVTPSDRSNRRFDARG